MKVNKESIKVEMTVQEYKNMVFCLRQNAEKCHISLMSAKNRGEQKFIDSSTKMFEMAVESYENLSGNTYDISKKQRELGSKLLSLKRF